MTKKKIKENSLEFIHIKHKCGRVWKVTKSALKKLRCPYCKTSKGFSQTINGKPE